MITRKSVVLVIVMGTLIVFSILALTSMHMMIQQANISEKTVRRTKAYYTAQAGIVHAMERLRIGGTDQATITAIANEANNLSTNLNEGKFPLTIEIVPRGNGTATCQCPNTAPSDFCVCSKVTCYTPLSQ